MKKLWKDKDLLRIIVGGLLLIAGFIVKIATKDHASAKYAVPIVFAVALLVSGLEVFWEAIRGIFKGQLLDETFLMSIASVGAFIIGEYAEAPAVMLFYLVGEYFEHRAVRRSRASIKTLMEINPDRALVSRDGEEVEIDATDVKIGDTVVLRPGSRVPVDCTVVSGNADINTAALTGESLPVAAHAGTALQSGVIVMDGVLYAKADRTSETSAAARVLNLVQEASDRKSRQENFITGFARVYTPIVVGLAVLVAFLPPLFICLSRGGFDGAVLREWVYRALMFLVVSCPCALVISVPLAFFGGIGGAAGQGILFKGGCSFDSLAAAKIAVFDKTGTLTKGAFSVTEVSEKTNFSALSPRRKHIPPTRSPSRSAPRHRTRPRRKMSGRCPEKVSSPLSVGVKSPSGISPSWQTSAPTSPPARKASMSPETGNTSVPSPSRTSSVPAPSPPSRSSVISASVRRSC